jgi:dihydroorotate dehydrogenase
MRFLYQRVLKPILFCFDPERVHHWFVALGGFLGLFALTRGVVSLVYGNRRADAAVVVDGIRYPTPIVLAAGFDYNGKLTQVLKAVAFGGVEVGSITALPTEGNPSPRLTRLIKSKSLLVNKGLRNEGVDRVIQRLKDTPRVPDFVVGVSIARSNAPEAASLEGGIADYRTSLERLVAADVGDYYTINISCPNVYGGESFADPHRLRLLLTSLCEIEHDRPMYAKMPISVSADEFDALMEVVDEFNLHGVVIGNLNKDYKSLDVPGEAPAEYRGGLSGRPCFEPSNEHIRRTRAKYGDRFTIIGCGGILSAADAMEKFRAGADMVQLITGMIFEGPHLMKEIARAYAEEREALRDHPTEVVEN